jgi:ABC-type Na+ efflux pump permease subunit
VPEFQLPLFLIGCLGGILPDLLRIARNRYETGLKNYLKSLDFWAGLVILILVGGVTAWILEAESAKDALIVGYTSPQIISQLVGSIKERQELIPLSTASGITKLTNWWAR